LDSHSPTFCVVVSPTTCVAAIDRSRRVLSDPRTTSSWPAALCVCVKGGILSSFPSPSTWVGATLHAFELKIGEMGMRRVKESLFRALWEAPDERAPSGSVSFTMSISFNSIKSVAQLLCPNSTRTNRIASISAFLATNSSLTKAISAASEDPGRGPRSMEEERIIASIFASLAFNFSFNCVHSEVNERCPRTMDA